MRISVGEILGQYRIESMIGHGSMSNVYRAVHLRLGRRVAIKIIHPSLMEQPGVREQFSRNVKALENLRHPNVVRVYEHAVQDDTAYLIMEYLGGGTLTSWIKKAHYKGRDVSLKQVLLLIDSIGNAIDYAHAQGLVHRDLKPSNVLFRDNGEPVLTNFGLGFLSDQLREASGGITSGTPAYLSPEQAQGEKGDARSDVYSLGCILYEMLTGAPPFDGSAETMIQKHISEPPPNPKIFGRYLPEEVESVVFRSLAKSPVQRYQSAGVLARSLRAAVERSNAPEILKMGQETKGSDGETGNDGGYRPSVSGLQVSRPMEGAETASTSAMGSTYSVPASKSSPWGRVLSGGLLLLALVALGYWAITNTGNSGDSASKPALYSRGSMVRISIQSSASVSVYNGCPGSLIKGVIGIASNGQSGMVKDKKWCGGEWWYRIEILDLKDSEWGGVGWVSNSYLKPR